MTNRRRGKNKKHQHRLTHTGLMTSGAIHIVQKSSCLGKELFIYICKLINYMGKYIYS